jgi:tetratricopeptide (TPR) repeat protein
LAKLQVDYGAAEALYHQSVTLCREINERRGEAYGLSGLAELVMQRAQYAEAEPLLVESVALARVVGDPILLASSLTNLAIAVRVRGDAERAFQAFEEALTIARDAGNEWIISQILRDRGRAACHEGMVALAEESLVKSLRITQALGAEVQTAETLESFAELGLAKHAPERAARIWGATEHLREEADAPIPLYLQAEYQTAVATARAALGDDAFDRAWNEGRAMPLEEVVRYALGGQAKVDA